MSPTRPRPLRPPVFDVLLAAALTIVLVIGPGPRDAFPMLLAVALVAPPGLASDQPVQVFAVCAGAALLQWWFGWPLMPPDVGLLFALYAVTVHARVVYPPTGVHSSHLVAPVENRSGARRRSGDRFSTGATRCDE